MSTLIFGDVHGELRKIQKLVGRAQQVTSSFDLVTVGDLVDRGPKSRDVVQFCIDSGVEGVCGNHELWIRSIRRAIPAFDPDNPHMGVRATLQSYGAGSFEELSQTIPDTHVNFFNSLVPFAKMEEGGRTFRITHGGIPANTGRQIEDLATEAVPDMGVDQKADTVMEVTFDLFPSIPLWAGAKPGDVYAFKDGSIQVFGHTPWSMAPRTTQSYVALDGGCGTRKPNKLFGLLILDDGATHLIDV